MSSRDQMFAKVVLDSVSPEGKRLTTMHLHYPRIIHSEVMTHRVFSRNARSSRAVPVKTMLEEARNNPFVPWHWGKNQKGMQASKECTAMVTLPARIYQPDTADLWGPVEMSNVSAWLEANARAVEAAEAFSDAGYHKQIANRLLEPFSWIDTLVSSTSWANFYALRDHDDAEPHFHDLAALIRDARDRSTPTLLKPGEWHLPYVATADEVPLALYIADKWPQIGQKVEADRQRLNELMCKLSTARCARISYKPFDGNGSIDAEIARHDALVAAQPLHASPTEHQATPDTMINGVWQHPEEHGNFTGWRQYRKTLPGEYVDD